MYDNVDWRAYFPRVVGDLVVSSKTGLQIRVRYCCVYVDGCGERQIAGTKDDTVYKYMMGQDRYVAS